jgi:hypothetical protein
MNWVTKIQKNIVFCCVWSNSNRKIVVRRIHKIRSLAFYLAPVIFYVVPDPEFGNFLDWFMRVGSLYCALVLVETQP